ncbi:MAG: zinc-dependent metalloprotease [Bacteroidales bacterium]|nr:zinc-dependent metalloprotease [Bacteroidales bacterium]
MTKQILYKTYNSSRRRSLIACATCTSYPKKGSVIFKDKYYVILKLAKDKVVKFSSKSTADTNFIYVYRSEQRIGKLIVKYYQSKIYKLVMVSVNGGKLSLPSDLKKYIDNIYHQVNVDFKISTTTLEIKDLLPFKHGDKKRLSGYNDDQKRVLQAFDSQAKDDINYLFFMPDGVETNGVAGYNPFGYNFGFIYHGAGMRTIAHELGHGIGSLTHPFDDQTRDQAKTANLMDYNDKEELYHFQWNAIQNPPKRIFKWNFEEEGAENEEYITLDDISEKMEDGFPISFEKEQLTFLTPAGLPITLPKNVKEFSFISKFDFCPDGVLTWFNTENEKYVGYYRYTNKEHTQANFMGYAQLKDENAEKNEDKYVFENGEIKFYIDDFSKNLTEYSQVSIMINKLCELEMYQIDYRLLKTQPNNNELFNEYTGQGICNLEAINYNLDDYPIRATFRDEQSCILQTDYALQYYLQNIKNVTIQQRSVILRIAQIFDKYLLKDTIDKNEINLFLTIFPVKSYNENQEWNFDKYLQYENELNKFLMCKHKDDLSASDIEYNSSDFKQYIEKYTKSCDINTIKYIILTTSNETNLSFWGESVVIEALRTITEENAEQLMTFLETENEILKRLCSKIDNGNFTLFIDELFRIFLLTRQEQLKVYPNANTYYQKHSTDNNCFIWYKEFNEQRNVRLVCDFENNKIRFQTERFLIEGKRTPRELISPFDVVFVWFGTVPDFMEKYNIQNGTCVAMPAIFLYWINNEHNCNEIEKYVNGTLTIASFLASVVAITVSVGVLSVASVICSGAEVYYLALPDDYKYNQAIKIIFDIGNVVTGLCNIGMDIYKTHNFSKILRKEIYDNISYIEARLKYLQDYKNIKKIYRSVNKPLYNKIILDKDLLVFDIISEISNVNGLINSFSSIRARDAYIDICKNKKIQVSKDFIELYNNKTKLLENIIQEYNLTDDDILEISFYMLAEYLIKFKYDIDFFIQNEFSLSDEEINEIKCSKKLSNHFFYDKFSFKVKNAEIIDNLWSIIVPLIERKPYISKQNFENLATEQNLYENIKQLKDLWEENINSIEFQTILSTNSVINNDNLNDNLRVLEKKYIINKINFVTNDLNNI